MPTVVTTYTSGALDGTYILPPILYPDGHYYVKLGHHDHFERTLETQQEVEDWYREGTGEREAVEELARFITTFILPLSSLPDFLRVPTKASPS